MKEGEKENERERARARERASERERERERERVDRQCVYLTWARYMCALHVRLTSMPMHAVYVYIQACVDSIMALIVIAKAALHVSPICVPNLCALHVCLYMPACRTCIHPGMRRQYYGPHCQGCRGPGHLSPPAYRDCLPYPKNHALEAAGQCAAGRGGHAGAA